MELGKIQELEIVKIVDFGVYVGTKEDNVLLPKREVPEGAEMGDVVKLFVCRDSQDRLIATNVIPVAQVGETARMKVNEVTKYGAFLDWGLGKDLFLPYKEQVYPVKTGDEILVGVYIDKSERLCGTMKVYNYLRCNSVYEAEDEVSGTVYNINPQYGVFVAVDDIYHGLIQQKELTRTLKIGESVNARVKSVRTDGKLDLAMRKKAYIQIDEDAEKIIKYMENNGGIIGYTDKAAPEKIRQDFQMSKNEFKRAIGRLLKEQRVFIGENSIKLKK